MDTQEPLEPDSIRQVELAKILFSILFLCLFISCSKNKNNKSVDSFDDRDNLNSVIFKEAKYSDIPVPIGYKFVDLKSDTSVLDYLSLIGNCSLPESLDFYLKSMEVLGWDIDNFSSSNEVMLVCNKLNRSCVISIRSNKSRDCSNVEQSQISIFIRKNLNKGCDKIKDINSKVLVKQKF